MYIPAHFAAGELSDIAAFVDRVGSADLVTFDGTSPVATLLPVIWERPAQEDSDGEPGLGRLIGHVALQNPQWSTAAPGVPALAIVHGPQAYISPSWYESTKEHGRTVPTWNYTTVHFTGQLTFHTDPDWLRDVVTRLTERYETGRQDRWWVTDAPEKFVAGQLRAIVGVELDISRIEAKDKLSQNRTEHDRANVITALRQEPDPQASQIADLMEAREAQH
jgi:transcriptional regulator